MRWWGLPILFGVMGCSGSSNGEGGAGGGSLTSTTGSSSSTGKPAVTVSTSTTATTATSSSTTAASSSSTGTPCVSSMCPTGSQCDPSGACVPCTNLMTCPSCFPSDAQIDAACNAEPLPHNSMCIPTQADIGKPCSGNTFVSFTVQCNWAPTEECTPTPDVYCRDMTLGPKPCPGSRVDPP